jgi:hypothetical protein
MVGENEPYHLRCEESSVDGLAVVHIWSGGNQVEREEMLPHAIRWETVRVTSYEISYNDIL